MSSIIPEDKTKHHHNIHNRFPNSKSRKRSFIVKVKRTIDNETRKELREARNKKDVSTEQSRRLHVSFRSFS